MEAAEDKFGADNVDIQSRSDSTDLVIHWDKIEVSNERDEKYTIYDMYAKVMFVKTDKLVGFKLTRTSLTRREMEYGYIFSHVNRVCGSSIPYLEPCLGKGPIRNTIASLAKKYDADLFGLFLLELDRYVRTESLQGIPYVKFSEIGNGRMYNIPYMVYGISPNKQDSDIPKYVLEIYEYIKRSGEMKPKRIGIGIGNVSFGSIVDVAIKVSRLVVEYLRRKNDFNPIEIDTYLARACISEGNIYTTGYSGPYIRGYIRCAAYFNGENVPFKIIDDDCDGQQGDTYIVRNTILSNIMSLLYRDYYLEINGMHEQNSQWETKAK